jgi:hypothetical protein
MVIKKAGTAQPKLIPCKVVQNCAHWTFRTAAHKKAALIRTPKKDFIKIFFFGFMVELRHPLS